MTGARRRCAALAASVALAGAAPAARAQSTGTTAGAILTIPATARALGLGGAYTAVVGDEANIFVNPAGLAAIGHAALGVSYEKYLLDSYLVSGGIAFRAGEFDLGLGVVHGELLGWWFAWEASGHTMPTVRPPRAAGNRHRLIARPRVRDRRTPTLQKIRRA